MELLFRELQTDEVERPPTQRDQFNNDDVALAEALVRESFQNSLDASTGPVHIRIAFHEPSKEHKGWFRRLLHESQLKEHLAACDISTAGLDFGSPRLLVIEDFGTTGLTGRWDEKDNEPFSDFWRRMGRSHKGGRQLGRWGLGKIVFSSASHIRCFFGLTVRHTDPGKALLMGQAVLTHHRLQNGKDYDSHGFFAIRKQGGLQLPETQPEATEQFRVACGLTRLAEPGLSIVVPFIDGGIQGNKILEFLIRNYFFPVLTGQLTADVCGTRLDESTFNDVAMSAGGERFADGSLAAFIREVNEVRRSGKLETLGTAWTDSLATSLPSERIEAMRMAFAKSEGLIAVRAPLTLKRKDGSEVPSHVDLFLRRAANAPGTALFIRDSITLPAEAARYFKARNCFAALVADDEGAASFLGDAENPAHTSWSLSAEKLTSGWRNPQARLTEIRTSLQKLYDLLSSAIEEVDLNALIDSFSVRGEDGAKRMRPRGPVVRAPVVPANPPTLKSYRLLRRRGGFAVKAGPGLSAEKLPLQIRIRVAYDVPRGNPFAKHSPFDFDFTGNAISIKKRGAAVAAIGPGTLAVDALDPDFEVEVEGFDPQRDLAVDPAKRT